MASRRCDGQPVLNIILLAHYQKHLFYLYIYVYIAQYFIVIAFWRVFAVSSVSSVTLSVVAMDFTRYTYRCAIR